LGERLRQIYRLVARGNRFYSSRQRELNKVLEHCDAVVAGNAILAGYAKRFVRKSLVALTPIDVRAVPLKQYEETAVVTIGWTGTPDNVNYLEAHGEAFKALGKKYGDRVRLKIVSQPRPMRLDGIKVEFQQWSPEIDKSVLLSFDIGIMPLTDDGWSQGKCGFKALLCMAAGLPTVVSPVGVNAEIITDGVDGFHAGHAEEWVEKISRLIENPALRMRLGTEARHKVQTCYDITPLQIRIGGFLRESCVSN
jgi:glycosyltransferase involved in cell wall biosynthesis